MEITETLLKQDPKEAIVMMLNLENGTNFCIDDIDVGPPSAGTVKNTKVTLTVRRPAGENDEVNAGFGSLDFEYNRLDVAHHFNGILGGVDIQTPTSTQVLLNIITDRIGQEFTLDDIVLEDIGRHNSAAYSLRAKSESHRWYGSILIRIGDVVDINEVLDSLMPDTLGDIEGRAMYSLPNVSMPFLNLTSHVSEMNAVNLNTTTQEGAAIEPIFSRVAKLPFTPDLRVPLHKNTHFQLGTTGWTLTKTNNVNINYILSSGRMGLHFGSDNVAAEGQIALHRTVELTKNRHVELTYRIAELQSHIGAVDPYVRMNVVINGPNGWSDTLTVGDLIAGSGNLFFIAPIDGTYDIDFIVLSADMSLALSELAVRSFPREWVIQQSDSITSAAIVEDSSGLITLVGDELSFGGGTNTGNRDLLRVALPINAGRGYALSFIVDQVGSGTLQLCLATAGHEPLVSFAVPLAGLIVGKKETILFTMPNSFSGNTICFAYPDTGASVTKLSGLEIRPLPLPYGEDILQNNDFSAGMTGFTVLSPASGQTSFYGGYLRGITQTSTAYGFNMQTPALLHQERYSVEIVTIPLAHLNLNGTDRYVGVNVQQTGAAIKEVTSGGSLTWNQTQTKRFLNPTTVNLTGQLNAGSVSVPLSINLYGFENSSGTSITSPFTTIYRRVAVRVSYAPWVVDAGATKTNLYNARLTVKAGALLNGMNGVINFTPNYAEVRIDPAASTEYSNAVVTLPYVPQTSIQNRFVAISQLSRFGLVTAEDGTYIRSVLQPLEVNDVINQANFPASFDGDPTQNNPWTVSPTAGVKNLYDAVVQYNGPIRPQDPVPATAGLENVCVLFLSPTFCTGYSGQVRFYYNGRVPV